MQRLAEIIYFDKYSDHLLHWGLNGGPLSAYFKHTVSSHDFISSHIPPPTQMSNHSWPTAVRITARLEQPMIF